MYVLLRDTIFLVDSSSTSRGILRKTFEGKYNILEAANLPQAQTLFRDHHSYIAAILLDMKLVGPHGRDVLAWLLDNPELNSIPLIAVVDVDDVQNEHRAFQLGVTDVIFRPLHSVTSERRIHNLIELFRTRWSLEAQVEEQKAALLHTNNAIVDALSSIIEGRSVESGQHVLRIRRFTKLLLEEIARSCPEYGLTSQAIESISSAAALHDIGKIAIPDAILNKPGKLTEEEFAVIKTHTTAGSEMLERMHGLGSEEYLRYAYSICRYHHERWNGEGYPDGLKGDAIPLCAQVVGIADCYDALTTERVYKPAYSSVEATNMILNGDCGSFSPVLLECFKLVNEKMADIASAYADGASPRNDAITAPLAQPAQAAAGSLQTLMEKYTMLLRYLDATIIELDLDKRLYHVAYNADSAFDFIAKATGRDVSFERWSENMYNAQEEQVDPLRLMERMADFFASGLRQKNYHTNRVGPDGTLQPYTITVLRRDTEDGSRSASVICKKEPVEKRASLIKDGQYLYSADKLIDAYQLCSYDAWLTMPKVGSALQELLGYTESEIMNTYEGRLLALVPQEERADVEAQLRRQLSYGSNFEVEIPLRSRTDKIVWVIGKGMLLRDSDDAEWIYLIFVNITPSMAVREKLYETLTQQELIVAQTSDIVFELDFTSDQLTTSGKWEERFGYTPISENFCARLASASHFHPDDVTLFLEKMELMKNGTSFVEFPIRVADITGRYQWSRVRAATQTNEQGHLSKAVGVIIDMTNEFQESQALIENVDRDALTKLLNKEACRRAVQNHLEEAQVGAESVMAIIDLDNFKEINDQYGHLFGDAILTKVSSEITHMFRGTDVVGRIGGDEFLVYLPHVNGRKSAVDRFEVLVESIQNVMEFPVESNFSCSIGIACAPEHGKAYEDLFKRADRALYQAKEQGKGCCCVFSEDTALSTFATMVSKRIDSNVEPGMAENGLIQHVFSMLYESDDLKDTINSLLALVGKQMNVSRVYIFENDASNERCSNTFEWCNDGIEPQIDSLQNISYRRDIAGFRESFNERGIFYSPDVTQLPQNIRNILEPQGIRSMLACAIRDKGKFVGYVGFDENTRLRLWTQEQIDLLVFLSQVVSLFLLKYRMQERSDAMVEDLRNLLDRQNAWIYVVEPETQIIRFMNRPLLEQEPEAQVGMVCYKALKGQDFVCQACPIQSGGCCKIHNQKKDLHMVATAETIRWEGDPAWLVICQEL